MILYISVTSVVTSFFVFLILFYLGLHCVYSFLSEVQWAFLWPLLLTLYQVNYLSMYHSDFFWVFTFFFCLEHFLCFFILPDSLCYLYVLDEIANSPSREEVALYKRLTLLFDPCPDLSFLSNIYSYPRSLLYFTLPYFFLLAAPAACRSSQARDRTYATAASQATTMTMLDP